MLYKAVQGTHQPFSHGSCLSLSIPQACRSMHRSAQHRSWIFLEKISFIHAWEDLAKLDFPPSLSSEITFDLIVSVDSSK